MVTSRRKLGRALSWLLLIGSLGLGAYVLVLRPTEVGALRVSRGVVIEEALGTGSVESRRTVGVSFEVAGRITQILVDQGDEVRRGQKLALLDDQTLRAEVALAEQEVALAQVTLRRQGAEVQRARATLNGATNSLARISPLVESGAVSAEELDAAKERFQVASAELSGAEAAELEGREGISTAQRRLDLARVRLERSAVYSSVDGVVLRRAREVGDVVVPGAEVLRLAATDTVWASVWVDETHLDALAVDLPVRLALRSEPQHLRAGSVSRIGREVDRETRELLVDVAFEELPERMAFGQRVDLWIELDRHDDVVRIPSSYIVHQDGATGAFVAEEGRASFRALQLGKRGRDVVEVEGGLEPGELLLDPALSKKKRLKSGQRVRPVEREDEAEAR